VLRRGSLLPESALISSDLGNMCSHRYSGAGEKKK
jgi:hypothetical protein